MERDTVWELGGYGLWLIGSALFAVTSWRANDMTAFVASLLFFFGIICVMVPMWRRHAEATSGGRRRRS